MGLGEETQYAGCAEVNPTTAASRPFCPFLQLLHALVGRRSEQIRVAPQDPRPFRPCAVHPAAAARDRMIWVPSRSGAGRPCCILQSARSSQTLHSGTQSVSASPRRTRARRSFPRSPGTNVVRASCCRPRTRLCVAGAWPRPATIVYFRGCCAPARREGVNITPQMLPV